MAFPEVINSSVMRKQESAFRIIHPHAAGIDVGSRSHMVTIDQVKENVREFGVYTKDHEELITHLYACGVTTIAMVELQQFTGGFLLGSYFIFKV
jgi:hypothetical protein